MSTYPYLFDLLPLRRGVLSRLNLVLVDEVRPHHVVEQREEEAAGRERAEAEEERAWKANLVI